jgi:hypothetical protein
VLGPAVLGEDDAEARGRGQARQRRHVDDRRDGVAEIEHGAGRDLDRVGDAVGHRRRDRVAVLPVGLRGGHRPLGGTARVGAHEGEQVPGGRARARGRRGRGGRWRGGVALARDARQRDEHEAHAGKEQKRPTEPHPGDVTMRRRGDEAVPSTVQLRNARRKRA